MKRLLIFAHYQANGILRPDIVHMLNGAVSLFDTIFLVSTNLKEGQEQSIPKVNVVRRSNFGYDFYSYREGMFAATNGMTKLIYDQIYLLNSSIVFFNPDLFLPSLILMEQTNEVFGLTRSNERETHIQSYCISFAGRLLENNEFKSWWSSMVPHNDRHNVIEIYEYGLSRLFKRIGFELGKAFDQDLFAPVKSTRYNFDISNESIKGALNPTHFYWRDLFEQFRVIKLELLSSNPYHIDISSLANEDPSVIEILKDFHTLEILG